MICEWIKWLCTPPHTFWVAATALSIFFGLSACKIFGVSWPKDWKGCVYQFWLNFCGSFVGWAALGILIARYSPCFAGSCEVETHVTDFGVALVAFAGITGHIPLATVGIFEELKKAAVIALAKLFGANAEDKKKEG